MEKQKVDQLFEMDPNMAAGNALPGRFHRVAHPDKLKAQAAEIVARAGRRIILSEHSPFAGYSLVPG